MEYVAVQGATFSYASPITGGPPPIVGPPSLKCMAGGSGIYQDSLPITCPIGVTDGTCTTTAPGVGNMAATATKATAEGSPVLRVGDSLTISGVAGVLGGGGGCVLNITVDITDAGQAKVRAN